MSKLPYPEYTDVEDLEKPPTIETGLTLLALFIIGIGLFVLCAMSGEKENRILPERIKNASVK